jgi:hypothetical protein
MLQKRHRFIVNLNFPPASLPEPTNVRLAAIAWVWLPGGNGRGARGVGGDRTLDPKPPAVTVRFAEV